MHIPLSPLTLPWPAKQSRVPRSASPVVGFLSSNLLGITAKQRYWVGSHMMKTPKNSPITKKLSAAYRWAESTFLRWHVPRTRQDLDCPTIFAVVIPMKMGLWQPQTLGQVPNVIAVTSVPNGNDTHTNTVGGSRLAARNGKSGLYGGGWIWFPGKGILYEKNLQKQLIQVDLDFISEKSRDLTYHPLTATRRPHSRGTPGSTGRFLQIADCSVWTSKESMGMCTLWLCTDLSTINTFIS